MNEETLQAILKDFGNNLFDNTKEITKLKNVIAEQEKTIEALKKEVDGVYNYYGARTD